MSGCLPFLCHHPTIPYSHLLHTAQMFIVGVWNSVCIDLMNKKEFLLLASKALQADVLLAADTGLCLLRSWCTTQAWLPSSQTVGADRIPKTWSLASRTPLPSSACAGTENAITGSSESLKANFRSPGTIVCFNLGWPVLFCIFRAGVLPEHCKRCLNPECWHKLLNKDRASRNTQSSTSF